VPKYELKTKTNLQNENLKFALALSQVSGIGRQTLKFISEEFRNLSDLFDLSATEVSDRTGFKPEWTEKIRKDADFKFAKKEMEFCDNNDIRILLYGETDYPSRLAYCQDAPAILFAKGNIPFDSKKWLAIVGTRKATAYGKDWCKKLIEDLAELRPVIVSGLALGIDIAAHRAALENELPTIAVLGHGLDSLYPGSHLQTSVRMQKNGGLMSEYGKGTKPDAQNFPERNRIIAGMCDGTIVVEGAESGGAMITADIAFSYSREVMALPGRTDDTWSKGCNALIKYNKASLVENAEDVCRVMGWKTKPDGRRKSAPQLFPVLEKEEDKLFTILRDKGALHVDELTLLSGLTQGEVAVNILNLELKSLVSTLPGKVYKIK
jgi:DNA processing protein